MSMSPNEYLEGLSNGDNKVIADIYNRTYPKVVKFVLNNSGNPVDAEDVFQKALLQFIARYRLKKFVIKDSFEGYFFQACKNLWRRELNNRKKQVTKENIKELISEEHDMALATLEQEKWELFQEKLEELSENCKTILQLFFKKTPYVEIAEKMKYASDNVLRQRIFKCKKKLSELIKKDFRYTLLKEL